MIERRPFASSGEADYDCLGTVYKRWTRTLGSGALKALRGSRLQGFVELADGLDEVAWDILSMIWSMKALSWAGVVPCHSGKTTRCCTKTMALW